MHSHPGKASRSDQLVAWGVDRAGREDESTSARTHASPLSTALQSCGASPANRQTNPANDWRRNLLLRELESAVLM